MPEPLKPTTGAPPRAYDIDNFRTCLTGLVIFHHTAISYGGVGSWPYKSSFHAPNTSIPLMAFNAINQSYFMGSFFFLSGYFSSKALKRKGAKEFLKTKYLKLGLPSLIATAITGPIGIVILRLGKGEKIGSFDRICLDYWKTLRGIRGSVWYLGTTVVFDTIYAFSPNLKQYTEKLTTLQGVNLDILACYLIRVLFPLGHKFVPLNIQTCYFPQYVAAYTLGTSLSSPTPPITSRTRNILAATSILTAATGLSLLYLYPEHYPVAAVGGGPNLLAFCYAAWGESTGYLLGTTILGLFKSKEILRRKWGEVATYAYPAFLVHPIVCIGLQVWSDPWKINGVLKTAVLGTAITIGSWAAGWGLVKFVPGANDVLL